VRLLNVASQVGNLSGSVAKINFGTNLVNRNGLVEPFNNLKFVDFGVFATEPVLVFLCVIRVEVGNNSKASYCRLAIRLFCRRLSVKTPQWLVIMLLLSLALGRVPALARDSRSLASGDHLVRGVDLASRKYVDEAASEFDKCIDLTPANGHQLKVVAQTYFDVGNTSCSMNVIAYALSQERVKREKGEMHAQHFLGSVVIFCNRAQCRNYVPKSVAFFVRSDTGQWLAGFELFAAK
jgi:hypothetical protein